MEVEFKLFGAFTVKQFAYLAAGFVGALIIYFSILPFILKFFLIIFSVIAGIFLSIVRINDQPSSVWVGNFIKAMGKSSKLVWKKRAVTPDVLKEESELSVVQSMAALKKTGSEVEHVANRAHMPLAKIAVENEASLDVLEQKRLSQIEDHFDFVIGKLNQSYTNVPAARPARPAKVSSTPTMEAEPKVIDRNTQNLAGAQALRSSTITPLGVGDDLVAIHQPLQHLSITESHTSRDVTQPAFIAVSEPESKQVQAQEQVHNAQQHEEVAPSFVKSNIITGIVVDEQGNAIKDALVIVKTAEEELVRKIQSNSRGFVTLTTPLVAGTYFIDIEAKGYKFSRYQIVVNDQVLPVFKFVAK